MQISHGAVAAGFENVLDLFESFLAEDPAYSAQVSAYHGGVQVVGLAGGPDMAADTVTGAYSCSKGVAAMVIALLVQENVLDLDRPVAFYWPEFGVHGKDRLLVREALSHQAGLPGIEGGFGLSEITTAAAAARLASARPLWQPGRQFGYHALTIGILMEELCRRTSGESLQDLYNRRIRIPNGVDFFLGLPEEEEHRYRDVLYATEPDQPWLDPLSLDGLNSNSPVSTIMELPNIRAVRAAGMSAAGGVGSADGLARLYAAATTGVDGAEPFLGEDTVTRMSAEQVWGLDRSSGLDNAFAVVFMKPHPSRNFGSHRAFGHEGANAALGFADPAYALGFGYVPRRAEDGRTPGRAHRLAAAVRRSAAALA
ncbi:beta-lactamase [Pseudarthrobacter chlorophenolicus A6]|uniref:Beta-lactamase n=1 Tax=Pseudarthrobacter chlorophenolicus (strain ATCC 700700 / DSM 12829 / CIP 107037 / JCM 12360 / KCTC 9906 / NCIMB 13794 / A6) TaxID=452863 RepID=B8H8J2_PSECP|nr:EstA family serine hydrolase [Pseudarthrobacter chlorophenolicus]ACL39870.1 beta-lactamase [Pseudarthrobacter chlorophenolicus A6]SDQ92197.1 CubicO group peptidase, beta-lactamase class C family [Pseudarthrobacter chlorophenolicus]